MARDAISVQFNINIYNKKQTFTCVQQIVVNAPFLIILPVRIRQACSLQCFKSLLKTHLFEAAYL